MKTELNITEDQFNLLKLLVTFKKIELEKEQINLLACRDFSIDWKDIKFYENGLKEIQPSLSDIETILEQLKSQ